jgi:hypothetical protein
MLPGLTGIVLAAAAAPLTVNYTDSDTDGANSGTYTFTNKSIGTAASGRYVIVVAIGFDGVSNTFTSCTVAGNATTRVLSRGSNQEFGAIFVTNSPVASGTTATIVVNNSGTANRCAIAVYTVADLPSITPSATVNVQETDPSEGISVVAGGVIIAGAGCTSTGTATWTNMTENADLSVESANRATFASHSASTTETRTISVDFSSSSNDFMIAAAWTP